MIKASDARRATKIDDMLVEQVVEGTCAQIERAASKGERSVEAWFYDSFERKYVGDLPAAVVEEVDKRFEDAGYTLSWTSRPTLGGVRIRVYSW